MASPARTLRELLERKGEALVVPGAGSPLDLLLAEQAGFAAGYVSGYATAAHRFGLPDIGQVAFAEVADMVRATAAVVSIPLIVDADTGYGDVANVRRTVRGLEAAGAAAVQIEDQARHRANELIDQAKQAAIAEGERLMATAQQQIQLEQTRAREELRKQVAALAVAAASKLVEKEIDAKTHADLLNKLATQI